MKHFILTFLACFTCLAFVCSPMCCGAVGEVEIAEVILETIFSEFLGENIELIMSDMGNGKVPDSGVMGAASKILDKAYEIALQNATLNQDNDIQLTMPTFDIITGKEQLSWHIQKYDSNGNPTESFTDDILIEITFLLTDNWSAEYLDKNTGVTYYSNALNIAITRSNGSVKHYVVVYGSGFNYSRNVSWSYPQISITAQSGCTLYSVEGGLIGQAIETNFYTENVIFTISDTNSITTDCNSVISFPTGYYPEPQGIYSYRGSAVSANNPLNYPVDKDICHGVFYFKNNAVSSTSFRSNGFYCNRYLKTGFMITNNSLHSATNNSYYSVNNYSNNYYNYPITGGTIIDKDNYQSLDLPALSPVFDIDTTDSDWLDTLLALLPSLLDLLDGDLLPDLSDLLGRLLDFFGNMPDIGLQWNPDTSLNPNNYWELEFPSDDSGGGNGDITVNVEITRPKIPAINTSPHVTFYYPTVTTTALSSNVIQAGAEFVDWGKEVTDLTGTTNIIIICGLIGVGIMLIFKDW